jgi:hypothetical protein
MPRVRKSHATYYSLPGREIERQEVMLQLIVYQAIKRSYRRIPAYDFLKGRLGSQPYIEIYPWAKGLQYFSSREGTKERPEVKFV